MKLSGILTILLSLGASLHAEVPSTLQYQGRVLQDGQPFDGSGHFVFGIYEGETLLWTNKLPVPSPLNDPATAIDSTDSKELSVRNGVFTVRLGEGDANNAPVGTEVFFKFDGTQRVRTDVKLKVWFSPAAEGPYTKLEPDITFASVPFAQVAGVAEMVKEFAVTAAMLSDHAVETVKIADGALSTPKLEDSAVTSAKIEDGTLVAADLSATLQADCLVPPGSVMPFAGTIAPVGWVFCDGSSQLKTNPVYARLFSVIGTGHGGDATTFNVPDYRGRFLRGVDGTNSRDPDRNGRSAMNSGGNTGNTVGSVQADEFKSHTHLGSTTNASRFTNTVGTPAGTGGYGSGFVTGAVTISPDGGSETRPKNAYVNYIIKL